jgi:hypothetical protein
MRRFLESAHDLSDPNHSHGCLSMHHVCNEIGLTYNDSRCQMIMSAHFRIGNLAAATGDRAAEPGWFRITPQGIDMVRRWRSSSAEPYR